MVELKNYRFFTMYLVLNSFVALNADNIQASKEVAQDQYKLSPELRDIIRAEVKTALSDMIVDIKAALINDGLKKEIREQLTKSFGNINPLEAIENYNARKDFEVNLDKDLEKRKQQLVSIQEAGVKKQKEFETMANVLTPEAREKKREELVQLQTQYQLKMESAKQFAEQADQANRVEILKLVQKETEDFRKENGYIAIYAGGMVSGDASVDVTKKVVERMNAKYVQAKKKDVSDKTSQVASVSLPKESKKKEASA